MIFPPFEKCIIAFSNGVLEETPGVRFDISSTVNLIVTVVPQSFSHSDSGTQIGSVKDIDERITYLTPYMSDDVVFNLSLRRGVPRFLGRIG